jgi:hypothetical protein
MRHRWSWIVIGCLASAAGCGEDELPRRHEVKLDLARRMVKKLAFEAYPQFALRPSNEGKCPTVAQLLEAGALHATLAKDPWGRDHVIRCGADLPPAARGVGVQSAGPDGKVDTADDVASWQAE